MSREGSSINLLLVFVEKISGIILTIVGLILAYYTYVSIGELKAVGSFFLLVGIILIFLGILMFVAKSR